MNDPEEQLKRMEQMLDLALEILTLARDTLLVNLRFLDMAMSRLTITPSSDTTMMTDGEHLIFSPKYVLKSYRAEPELPARDYLHAVMHCVCQHMFVDPTVEHSLWDLACDVAVENAISELDIPAITVSREKKQSSLIAAIRTETKVLTAEKIYAYLRDKDLSEDEIREMREFFSADDHSIWYAPSDDTIPDTSDNPAENDPDKQDTDKQDTEQQPPDNRHSDKKTSESNRDSGRNGRSREEIRDDWKNISVRMQVDLETFSMSRGADGGGLMQNLAEVNREKYDYTAFLKKFAVPGEAMRINDDEFDYVFYTYGLELYGNMPLIEPLEYKEVKRIRDFVIAIDTSGSTSGELVQAFLQKTYNILKSTESFFQSSIFTSSSATRKYKNTSGSRVRRNSIAISRL